MSCNYGTTGIGSFISSIQTDHIALDINNFTELFKIGTQIALGKPQMTMFHEIPKTTLQISKKPLTQRQKY